MNRLYVVAMTQAVALMLAADAFAQRPPASNQGPPALSLERAWAWLMARPGVLIAVGIMIVAIAYMVITRRRSKT